MFRLGVGGGPKLAAEFASFEIVHRHMDAAETFSTVSTGPKASSTSAPLRYQRKTGGGKPLAAAVRVSV